MLVMLEGVANQGFKVKTVLAFDFGVKRIGVAVGNTQLRAAQALTTLHSKSKDQAFIEIEKLIQEWQPDFLVVGLPRHPDGAEHEMTHKATRFGNQLHGRMNLPVFWVDERYTSAVIDYEENDIDSAAAALILEQFFSENKPD
jgi:putative Holliday junction resolvase